MVLWRPMLNALVPHEQCSLMSQSECLHENVVFDFWKSVECNVMPEFQIPPTSDGADWMGKLCFLVASLMRFLSFFCHFLPSKLT